MYWKYADIFKEMKGMSPDALTSNLPRMLEQLFGQCRLPLDHRGTVSIVPDDPAIEIPEWTPGDGSTGSGCGTQTAAQYFDSDTLGGGSGPPASLFVGSPGITSNQSIDNSGAGLPTVTGGYATYFCGNNYSETQVVEHFYVDQIFFSGGDTMDGNYSWSFEGEVGDDQTITNGEKVSFEGGDAIKTTAEDDNVLVIEFDYTNLSGYAGDKFLVFCVDDGVLVWKTVAEVLAELEGYSSGQDQSVGHNVSSAALWQQDLTCT